MAPNETVSSADKMRASRVHVGERSACTAGLEVFPMIEERETRMDMGTSQVSIRHKNQSLLRFGRIHLSILALPSISISSSILFSNVFTASAAYSYFRHPFPPLL